jgi:hypothetical protein
MNTFFDDIAASITVFTFVVANAAFFIVTFAGAAA